MELGRTSEGTSFAMRYVANLRLAKFIHRDMLHAHNWLAGATDLLERIDL